MAARKPVEVTFKPTGHSFKGSVKNTVGRGHYVLEGNDAGVWVAVPVKRRRTFTSACGTRGSCSTVNPCRNVSCSWCARR